MKRKQIQVHYLDGEVVTYNNETLEVVTCEIFEDTMNRDPEKITIDGELTLDWNPALFNHCFYKGRISEEELIEATKRN